MLAGGLQNKSWRRGHVQAWVDGRASAWHLGAADPSRGRCSKTFTCNASHSPQAKDLLARYGSAYLITSISFAIVSFAACYAAVDAGLDVAALLQRFGLQVGACFFPELPTSCDTCCSNLLQLLGLCGRCSAVAQQAGLLLLRLPRADGTLTFQAATELRHCCCCHNGAAAAEHRVVVLLLLTAQIENSPAVPTLLVPPSTGEQHK